MGNSTLKILNVGKQTLFIRISNIKKYTTLFCLFLFIFSSYSICAQGITYQQWETIGGGGGNPNWATGQANPGQCTFVEGDVTPERVKLTKLKPNTTYGIIVDFDYYQQNTNAGGRLYLDNYDATVDGGGDPDWPLSTFLTADNSYTFTPNDPVGVSYTSPKLTFYLKDIDNDGNLIDIKTVTYQLLNNPPTANTFRRAEIIFTTGSFTGTTAVDIYFGLYLALPGEAYAPVGGEVVDGAGGFTGGSLQTKIQGGKTTPGTINTASNINYITPSNAIQLQQGVVLRGTISGYKWDDIDGDGLWDKGETGIGGWTIEIFKDSDCDGIFEPGTDDVLFGTMITSDGATDVNGDGEVDPIGYYEFSSQAQPMFPLLPNTCYWVQEDLLTVGWEQTYPTSPSEHGELEIMATSPQFIGDEGDAVVPNFGNSFVGVPSLIVDKPAPSNADNDGSGDVSAGDVLTYTITATNDGTVPLTNVVVSDPMITPTGGTTPCVGPLAPGETCTLIGTYVVTAADVTAGKIDNTGTADSDQTAPVTDDESVSVPTPSLVVDKPAPVNGDQDGSGDVSVGDVLTYTITATNDGTANLTNVVVSDDLITPTGGTTPCVGPLAPGETCTLIGTYVVTAADVTAGKIDNTGTADSDQTAPVTDDESVSVPTPSLVVDKPAPVNGDQDGSGDVSVGDVLTYTITATNDGTANLTNVVVSDDLITPTGGTTPCVGPLAPGETCTLIGTYVVTAADVTAGKIDNTGTADSDQTAPVTDDESVSVPTPSLVVDKPAPVNGDQDGSGDVSVGDVLTYTITATNDGTANLTNVVVSDDLITPTGGTTPCVGPLAPGETCTLIGTYVVTAADVTAGKIDNTGTADSDQTAPVTDDESVSVPTPSLVVDKPAPVNGDQDGSGDVSVGDVLTYTITATNDGTANLTNVVVSDDLITPTGGTTPCVGPLAPGETCTLIGTYVVTAADVTAGKIDNTGTADSDQTAPVTDDESVSVPTPSLVVDKPAPVNGDQDGSGDVSVGDVLTYTITATNDGTANLTNVVVSDDLITPTGGTTPCVGPLAPGETCTLIGTYVVTAADVTAGKIDNTGTADSDQTAPVTDDESVSVPTPSLVVDKPAPVNGDQDGSGDVSVGDVLTYTITATNDGTANLTNVVVSDDLITPTGGTTPCVGPLAPGETCTLIGTYVVTAADVTAGKIDNTGTADSDQTAPVTDDESVSVPTPSLVVDKPAPVNGDQDGSGDVSVGDVLTYTITATNDGTANLTNVVVSDDLITPTGGTTPCVGPLAPGETCTLIGTYVVTAADVTAGKIDNTGTADSDQTAPVTDDESVSVPTPSLVVDKPAPVNGDQDGSGDVSVGDVLTYTITATNDGTANLTNVVVSDDLITPTGGTTPCVGPLAPGETCTLIGTYVVTAADVTAGKIDNTGTADSDQTAPVTDDESVSVPTPSLVVDKPAPVNGDQDGSGDVSVGDVLTYTITATNDGTANLTNVVVSDDLITPTGGTTPCVGPLAPGETCTLIGTYVVTAADVTAGKIDNTGTADSDQTAPVTDDESVSVPTPSLVVDKPAPVNGDQDGSGDVSVGDVLTYTITATNDGTANLTNVVVSDDLITPTGGTTPCVGPLAPGETCTLIGTYVVTAADVTAGKIDNTGTADSDQTAPVTDDESVSVPTPSLVVDKPAPVNGDQDGSGDVSVGDVLTYTITATNDGTANLTNVVVSDDLITPTGGTTPCVGPLAPGETCTLIGTYVVTAADVTAGKIDNTGTADSDQTAPVTDDESVSVPTPSLVVDKPAPVNGDQDGSGDVSVGDVLTYTITATNDGTANLTNVVVSDDLITPTGGTTPCVGPLAPGETCTLIGTYVVTAADVTAGKIDNTGTADSDQTAPVTDDESVSVPTPSLVVDKPAPVNGDQDGSGDVSVGDVLTYTITATNDGTANLTNVVVSDDLITPTGGTTPCVGPLAPGETCTLIGTYVVTAADVTAGKIDNTGTADSDQTAPVTDDESVSVPTPSLVVDKPAPVNGDQDGSGDVSVGDVLTYTITATNDGTANLTNVVVSDDLITPTGGTTPCVGPLAPGETCTLIGTYVVTAADVTAGKIDNTGTADSDQTAPVTDDESVSVPTPSLVVDKPAPVNGDQDGSGDVSVGDVLTYTITATNDGTANLTNVVVSDDLITPTGGTTPCVGPLAPGETCTLIGTYVVTAADVTAGKIDNTGTADSDQTAPVTDDESVSVPTPSLVVDKPAPVNGDQDGSGDVSVGDVLTYTITATNDGTANLTNVVVSDDLITPTGGTTPCVGPLAPGETCTLIGTYVVTAADVTAGKIDNTGTADSDQTAPVTDDESVSVPTPSLVVDKPAPVNGDQDGSGDVSVGDVLTYTITATNDGTANLTNVVVSDDLITPTGGTTPCVGPLAPGETCTLIGTYVVTAADVTAGKIDNTGTADSDQTAPVTDDESVSVPTPSLVVDKPAPVNGDQDGSGDVSVGDVLTYTITATNDGTANLTNVVVSDDLITPTGGTTPCVGPLAPGETCTLIGTYVVTAADVTAGKIDNTGTADSDQTAPVTDDESVSVPTPSLVVDKPAPVNGDQDGSGDVSVGDVLTYTITATNDGTANLTNVVVSDDLITPTGGTTPCVGPLAPGETCTLIGTYVVTAADVTAGKIDNTGTADSDQTAPVTDDESVSVPTPSLVVDKPAPVNGDQDGSGDVSVGDVLTYTITATNDGTANLTNVVVSDDLITPTGGTTPCVGPLAPGETCTLIGTYVVTAADVTAGKIDNTGTADSDQTAPVTDDESVSVPTPSLVVDKPAPVNGDQDGSGDVSVGDVLTYTITATNDGTANLTNVVVSDDLITPTGGTTPCVGPLAPGETCTLIGTYVVTAADVTAGKIDNTGTADSDQTAPVTDDESVSVPTPSLVVDKPAPVNGDQDGSGDVSVGDVLTYTITATNDGTANLTNVVVSDDLITPTGGTTPCVGPLAPGETCTLIGTYVVTAADVTAGKIDNTGTADSDQTAPVTDDESVSVPTPSLVVDKPAPVNGDQDGSGDVSVGDVLTYTITATNDGTANLTNVVVSDDLITPTGGTTPCVGPLAPGETCTLIGTYVVTAADVTAGKIDNTGTADSDQTAPVTDDESVSVPTPSLVVDKPAPVNGDQDGSGDVSVGDVLTYTITATNDGTANLTNVVVSDDLITPTGGTTPCVGPLAPGETCTLIGTYVVTAADVTAGKIDNTGTADSDQTAPVTDDESVSVPTPSLVVDKPAPVNGDQDGSGDVSVGDVLTYTITATNDGTANLTNVVVSDDLITPTGGTTPCVGPLAPGETCTLIGTYVVTAADVTAGKIDNTGTADSDQTAPVTDDESVSVPTPSLVVDKPAPVNGDQDGSGDVSVGDVLTYTITATNDGTANLTNVVVSDDLITPTGGTTPCVGPLAPGETCTLIGTYVVTAADVTAGKIDNTGTADSDQTAPVTDDESVSVPTPSLVVDKPAPVNGDQDGSGDVSVGDVLTYTITATNDGTANLTNVVVSDDLITPTGGTTPCVGPLAPGETCTLIGTYVVTAADVTAGKIDNTGTADSDQTAPVTDDESVSVPTPSLVVDKPAPVNGDQDGSGDVSVGDVLTYTITATNDGTANLTNVVVSDDLITPTGGTTPCVGPLAPGETCTLIGTYVVTAADVTAGKIDNTGTADSDQTAPVTDDESVSVPTPSLVVDKPAPVNGDQDGSGDVSVGDVLTYTITATNDGTANLTNVVVSDDLITPTGGTTPCVGPLAPGETCTLIGTYVVTAADVTAGKIDNTGTADSDQTAPVTDDESVSVPTPSLVVDKPAPVNGDQDGSGDVSVGDVLTYTITATNDGTANLTNVVVSDDLITPTGGTTPCVGPLAPGETCTLIGTYVVTAADVTAGKIDNTGTADSDQTAPVTDDESVSVPTPSLVVDKPAPVNGDQDGSGDVSVGDVLTYTITATNDGTANLTNVVVSDDLITPTGGTTPCVGPLAPGETCTLIGTYVVTAADVTAGKIDNTGTADSDQTAPVTDDESVSVPTPSLVVDKPAPVNGDQDGSGDVSVGDVLTYTITATNDGTANLTNVVVSDDLITPTGGTTPCVGPLAPGETCTLIGTYVVTAADVTAGKIDNTGTADSDQTAPVTDDESVSVPTPSLVVDKPAPVNGDQDGSGDVSVGDVLTYTITATNDGTANLTNVVVSDDLITPTGGTTPCVGPLAPGETCTLIGTYVVTAADVTAGKIDNTGTADSDQTAPVTDDESVSVPTPSLVVDKPAPVNGDQDGSGDVSVGDVLTYTITATNDGTANLTNVVVSDDLITPTGGTTPCVGPLAPGETCTLIGTYVVTAADVTAGKIDNTGTADSDQTAPVTDDESVSVPTPSLVVDKPAPVNGDQDGSGDVSVGDVLTYTITATNDGTANLTNVVVSDDLITPTGGTTPCVGPLAPGETCTLIGTYVVTAADVTAGKIDNTGTADSDQTAPVTDDESVSVPTPSLVVDKPAPVNGDQDGSGDVSVGDVLTYTITATNDGTANLTNVVVSDDLITPTGGTTPCVGPLAPGETCTLIGTYVVTAADVTAGKIDNTGTADSDQTAPVTDDESVSVPTPSLVVDKPAPVNGDQDGSGDVSVGDVLTYTITATNDGTANLTNVVVSDDLITPTGGTTPCVGPLAPGETCTLIGTYVVTAADVTAGKIDNTGTADSDQTAPVTDDESVSVPTPSLVVDKPAPVNGDQDGSGDVSVGDVLTYTITATNDGTANLTNVVVSDDLITPTGGTTPCVGPLAPGETCTLIGTYVVTAADVTAGKIDNTGTADSDQTAPVTDDESVSVPTPSLVVDKPAPVNGDQDGSGDVSVGDVLTYTITATNDGTANLTNVVVSDDLITPTGGTTPCVGPLAPGETCTLIGTYVVTAADVTAGKIDNTGTADSDQTAPVTDDESVSVPTPSLVVDKPAPVNGDQDGSGDVSVGDVLTYTITATNDGTANLTNVVVSDDLITPTGGTTPCVGPLAPGETCTLIGTYVVTAADVTAGKIDNTGTADSDQTAPVTDDESVSVPTPSLVVDKPAPVNGDQDGSGDVSVGDVLTYTITATNDGTANLTNVVVSDDLITPTGGTTPCVGPLAPGETCTLIGTYVVTAADVTAGKIDNTGTADSDQTAPVTDDESVSVPTPSLVVDKPAPVNGDQDGSGDVSVGDVLTYTITATNDGTANLTNVVVSDDLITPTGGTTPCVGPLAPGETCTLIGTYVVTATDVTAGKIDNTGTADSDQTAPVTDDESVSVPTPSLVVDKPAPVNGDQDGSGDVSVGDVLTYTITATNDGTANLTNVVVSDPMINPDSNTCAGPLAPNGTCMLVGIYTVTQADVDAGSIFNTAIADSDQTGPVDDTEDVTVPQYPEISIVKTFTDDSVIAGGDGSSFTLVVTNEGNVTLSDVVIEDTVDSPLHRLMVTDVSVTTPTSAGGEVCAPASQNVSCTIPTLAVGESATITVEFIVDASVVEANGVGGVNDDDNVPNNAFVGAEAPQGDPGDPSDDITDNSEDSIDILVDIELSIVKTFDPADIEIPAPQGTYQTFNIEVSNAGPSDAYGVSIIDLVDPILEVTSITAMSSTTACSNSTGNNLNCTVDIPAGGSETITVEYVTAPFLDADSPYNTTDGGDDFYFVFVNGSILEGTTRGEGVVILDGVDITGDVTIVRSLTRNEIVFDPPGDDKAFTLHLSCSDPFTGGWGQSAGPVEGVDVNWQIAYFTIARFNNNGFLKSCGNVVNEFEVDNTAYASGEDSFEEHNVFDDDFVTVGPGITLDRLQNQGKRLTARLNNLTGSDRTVEEITINWPDSNGNLSKVWLTYGNTSNIIWQGNHPNPDADLDQTDSGWEGGILPMGEAILRFDFANKVGDTGYTIRVYFDDATWLDINVEGDSVVATNSKTVEESKVMEQSVAEEETTMVIYPNPATTTFNINLEGYTGEFAEILLFDLNGRQLLRVKEKYTPGRPLQINLPYGLNEGLYYVKLIDGKDMNSVPLIISKM